MNFKNVLFALIGLMLLCGMNYSVDISGNTSIIYYGQAGPGSAASHNCSDQYPNLVWNSYNITASGMVQFYDKITNASDGGVANGSTVIICKNLSNTTTMVDMGWAVTQIDLNQSGSAWSSAVGFNIVGNESNVLIYSQLPIRSVFNIISNNTNVSNFTLSTGSLLPSDANTAAISVNATNVRIFKNRFNDTSLQGVYLYNETSNLSVYENTFMLNFNGNARGVAPQSGITPGSLKSFRGINITNNFFNGTNNGSNLGVGIFGHQFYAPIIVNNNFSRLFVGVLLNYTASGGNLSGNRFINSSTGLLLNDANYTNVTSGTFSNNSATMGVIQIANSSFNNFTSFQVEGNSTTSYGIYLMDKSQNNSFSNITIYNNTYYGFYAKSGVYGNWYPMSNTIKNCTIRGVTSAIHVNFSANWTIINNTIYNVINAINLSSDATNVTVADNVMYNCSGERTIACVHATQAIQSSPVASQTAQSGSVFYNNRIYNSTEGFVLDLTLGSNHLGTFWNNTVINATWKAISVINYLVNFSGTNFVYNTSYAGTDVYVNGTGNFSTGNYNLTTEFLSFTAENVTNMTIKSVNLSVVASAMSYTGGNKLTTLSNVSLGAVEYAHILKLGTTGLAEYAGLNLTNLSDKNFSRMDVTFYYDRATKNQYDYVGMATNLSLSLNNWNLMMPNLLTPTKASVYVSNVTVQPGHVYNLLTLISYRIMGSSGATSSTSTSSKKLVDLSKAFTCSDGKLAVTVSPVDSGITVKLYNTNTYTMVSGTTDSDGKVSFTITKDGVYQIDSEATSTYLSASISDFELKLCTGTTAPVTPVTPVVEETTPVVTEETTEPSVVTVTFVTKEEVLVILSSADSVIVLAIKENKDVTSAKAKIEEANVLLVSGDFEGAKKLAEEALAFAQSAKVKTAAATTTPATTTPATTTTKPTQQGGFDLGSIVLILVVVIVVIVGIYYFTRMKGSGYKGQKGQRRF